MLQLFAVVVVFAVVITLVSRKWPMGYAMGLGAVLLALASGIGPRGLAGAVVQTVSSVDTYELAATVALISMMARLLKEFGLLDQMTRSLVALVRNVKLALALVPGLLGCLPVFGGAIMSAPMVDSLGDGLGLDGTRKSAVNLIFRHAWFFLFPFMPSLILTAKLGGVSVGEIIRLQFPLTIVTLIFGYLYLFRRVGSGVTAPEGEGSEVTSQVAAAGQSTPLIVALPQFLIAASPLIVSIGLSVGLHVRLVFALGAAVVLTIILGVRHPRCTPAVVWRSIDWMLVLTMFSIMLFKGVLDRAGFVKTLVASLASHGVPPIVLFIGLPLLTGFTSGAQQASISISLPLLMPLAAPGNQAAAVAVIYVSSFLGYFLSPLHLCLVLTAQFFKAKMAAVYREAAPVVAVIAVGLAVLAALTRVGLN